MNFSDLANGSVIATVGVETEKGSAFKRALQALLNPHKAAHTIIRECALKTAMGVLSIAAALPLAIPVIEKAEQDHDTALAAQMHASALRDAMGALSTDQTPLKTNVNFVAEKEIEISAELQHANKSPDHSR